MKIFFRLFISILILGIVGLLAEFIYSIPSHAFNTFRYYTIYGGGDKCLNKLETYSNDFISLGLLEDGKCRVKNAVRISSFHRTDLSSDLILSCPTALKVGEYLNDIGAEHISHMGTYNCRTIANSKIMSEHSYGTAIDIFQIDDANVKNDWNKENEKGKVLSNAYKVACKYFYNVITPDNDKAHYDHFHFDNGYGRKCF